MKRLAVLVHFDRDNCIDDYVYYYLAELKKIAEDIVFVTTSSIDDTAVRHLQSLCSNVIVRENVGYDFMSYKVGLESCDMSGYDEVLICNDSVYGPLFSLENVFKSMASVDCDFWGITHCLQFAYHIQSYFILFKKSALESSEFKIFWQRVENLESKDSIIFQYEIGLSQLLINSGLKAHTYVNSRFSHFAIYKRIISIAVNGMVLVALKELRHFKPYLPVNCNATLWFWDDLIKNNKMPYVKIAALRDNKLHLANAVNIGSFMKKKSNYPSIR